MLRRSKILSKSTPWRSVPAVPCSSLDREELIGLNVFSLSDSTEESCSELLVVTVVLVSISMTSMAAAAWFGGACRAMGGTFRGD